MIGGWKPKKREERSSSERSPFSICYQDDIVDWIVKELTTANHKFK